MGALLQASSLRLDVAGTPTVGGVDGLTLTTTGERVLVLGAPAALFEAAAGLRQPSRGEIRVEGMAPIDAVRARIAAGAALDPPMPPTWTPRRYVEWSARLAGHGRAEARELAAEAIARTKLEPVADARLRLAALATRRATVIAAALATGATTLLLEDPLPGLPAETAPAFARVLARACSDRRTAFFAGRVPLESPIALDADEAIVLCGSSVAAQGAPAEIAADERSFSLRIVGDVGAFARAVAERGARLLSPVPPPDAPPSARRGRVLSIAPCTSASIWVRSGPEICSASPAIRTRPCSTFARSRARSRRLPRAAMSDRSIEQPTTPGEITQPPGPRVDGGRLGVYAAVGATVGTVPLPWVPTALVRRVRGALVHDVALRHGLSLSREAREVLADPAGPEAATGTVTRALRYVGVRIALRALSLVGPVGAIWPLRHALRVYVLGYLFDRYLAGSRPRASRGSIGSKKPRRVASVSPSTPRSRGRPRRAPPRSRSPRTPTTSETRRPCWSTGCSALRRACRPT